MKVKTATEAYKNQSWKISEALPEHAAAFTATGMLPANIELLKHDLPKIEGITPIKGPLKIFEAASDPNRTIAIIPGLAGGKHIYTATYTDTTLEDLMPALKPFFGGWIETSNEARNQWLDPNRTDAGKPIVKTIQASLEVLDAMMEKLTPHLPSAVAAESQTIGFLFNAAGKVCLAYNTAQDTNPAIEGERK